MLQQSEGNLDDRLSFAIADLSNAMTVDPPPQPAVADGQEYATNVKESTQEVAAKVAASDFVGVKGAEEQASRNCNSCHEANRKFSLGGWKIK